MGTSRDTCADAAAELMKRERPGEADPSVSLSGADQHDVRVALEKAHQVLLKLEKNTKQWSQREQLRTQRAQTEGALRILARAPKIA